MGLQDSAVQYMDVMPDFRAVGTQIGATTVPKMSCPAGRTMLPHGMSCGLSNAIWFHYVAIGLMACTHHTLAAAKH